MFPLKVVLDTNALLRSISRRSSFSVVLDKLYEGEFELSVSNDILLEYEEKITDIFSRETAELILGALALLPNIKKVDIHYNLLLISADIDDNKFSDCASSAAETKLFFGDGSAELYMNIDQNAGTISFPEKR